MRPRFVLALPLVFACASFSEGESTTPAPGGPDAGNDALDGSGETVDGAAPEQDASVPDDDGGIPPPQPCGQTLVCDDFERDSVFDTRWSELREDYGGKLAIATQFVKSATRSLAVMLPTSTIAGRQAFLHKTVTPKARRLTARFWLHVVAIPADGDIHLADVTTETGKVFLMFQGGKLVLTAEGTTAGKADAFIPSSGGAHDIVLDYRAGATPKAIALIDGSKIEISIGSMGGGDATAFSIGATSADQGEPAGYIIDDVSLDRGF